MLCHRCQKDVHPVRALWGNSAASTGDVPLSKPGTFVNQCPDCGGSLPEAEPKVVSESLESALVRVQGDIARLEQQGALSAADSEALGAARAELGRLVARQTLLAKRAEPRVAQIEIARAQPTPVAMQTPVGAQVADGDDDFIVGAKRRLAALEQKLAEVPKLESEARKLRAMLAAAEQV